MPGSRPAYKPPKKRNKQKGQTPETADDYLDKGVSLEEAGEKWRTGDPVKSARFFTRALENYDHALSLFPDSFDIAYNKARIQYDITQHPQIRAQFPGSDRHLLEWALQSHERALSLDESNADCLFNTAQVRISLADALIAAVSVDGSNEELATKSAADLVQKAVGLFRRCLDRQEVLYAQSQQMQRVPSQSVEDLNLATSDPPVPEESITDEGVIEDRWALVEEPVTLETIYETAMEILHAYGTWCNYVSTNAEPVLENIRQEAMSFIETKLKPNRSGMDKGHVIDFGVAQGKFSVAVIEARFRTCGISITEYRELLRGVFEPVLQDFNVLCAYAEALADFYSVTGGLQEGAHLRWLALSEACSALVSASRLPHVGDSAVFLTTAGDAHMRYARAISSVGSENISDQVRNEDQRHSYLKAAEDFYRTAVLAARSDVIGIVNQMRTNALIKMTVANCLRTGTTAAMEKLRQEAPPDIDIQGVLRDMEEEELVDEKTLRDCGIV